jgi:competence transcription factor ComK
MNNQLKILYAALQPRLNRTNYLRKKFDSYRSINPEQAEAYAERINKHKVIILRLLEKIDRIENDQTRGAGRGRAI